MKLQMNIVNTTALDEDELIMILSQLAGQIEFKTALLKFMESRYSLSDRQFGEIAEILGL